MAVRTKVEPIDRTIALMLNEDLSPQARSRQLAEFAGEQIGQAKETNRSILGRLPHYTVAVDERVGASLDSVRPNGVIFTEFDLINDTLAWIGEQLVLHSPVGKTGRYQRSHILFADGVEIEVGKMIPAADQFVFLNTTEYARKIETGSSSQAPDGVFQAVAELAQKRFGNIAKIEFSYRAISGGLGGSAAGIGRRAQGGSQRAQVGGIGGGDKRTPAIIVTLGGR